MAHYDLAPGVGALAARYTTQECNQPLSYIIAELPRADAARVPAIQLGRIESRHLHAKSLR